MSDDYIGRFLPAGTKVRYDGLAEGGPEYGVVVHCWLDEDIGFFDCYVAFFGAGFPEAAPKNRPYVLRYASSSLTVIE